MFRHVKIVFIIFFLPLLLYAEKLSQVQFFTRSRYLSPNGDGFRDYIRFHIILLQNRKIQVKKWELYILNSRNKIIHSYRPEKRIRNQKHFVYIWDGKNQMGNFVSDGEYEAILKVFYNYANIVKIYSIPFSVYRDNFSLEMEFIHPFIIRKWDVQKQSFGIPWKEVQISQKYKKDFSISLEFDSYILDFQKKIIEKRNWTKQPRTLMLWNGYNNKRPADFSIYHYVFAYKNYEGLTRYFILPGIFVIPFSISYTIFPGRVIQNPMGYSYDSRPIHFIAYNHNNKKISLNTIKNHSKYYQVYCYQKHIFSEKWNFITDGIQNIRISSILKIYKKLPRNRYCLIIFFQKPISEFHFFHLYSYPIITAIPVYLDTRNPVIDLKLLRSSFRPDFAYPDFFQQIQLRVQDNTFIYKVRVIYSLVYGNQEKTLKTIELFPEKIVGSDFSIEKKMDWIGDSIEEIPLESMENLRVKVEAIDFAGNQSVVSRNFKTGMVFRKKGTQYQANIPYMLIMDKQLNFLSNVDLLFNSIIKEFYDSEKKYMFIRVHSSQQGDEEANLQKTEVIAEKIYRKLVQKISPRRIFYRGYGELYPYWEKNTWFAHYRNNRVEIIFSDVLNEEEEKNY